MVTQCNCANETISYRKIKIEDSAGSCRREESLRKEAETKGGYVEPERAKRRFRRNRATFGQMLKSHARYEADHLLLSSHRIRLFHVTGVLCSEFGGDWTTVLRKLR
ncbi:hypothetical protein KM043_016750 [Ampulex compressa]|nr:hypothetical protein KM043_016750 [Ampulex compressa]